MNEVLNILFLEDSPHDAEIIRELLISAGYDLNMDCTALEKEFVSFLRSRRYDIIISDFRLPGFDAFEALSWSVEICPDVPFICVSGTVGEETAIELLKKGAVDYILKDRLIRLPSAIQRGIKEAKEKKARQQAEETLKESERKLREAQEMAHMGFWSWDIKTGNVDWSEEVFKIFHLDAKVFTPKIDSILALSPWPEDHQRDKELINRAIESHSPGHYEQKFLRPDMSIGHYYSTFMGKYDEKGDLISIVGTVLDITERKQSEESLRLKNFVFDASIAANSISDINGIITEANDAFIRIWGFTDKSEVIGRPISDFLKNSDEALSIVKAIQKTGQWEGDYSARRMDDSTFIAHGLATVIKDEEGNTIGYQSAVIDMTKQKQSEEKLSQLALRQEAILSAVPDIIMEVDNNKVYTWANKAGFEFFGEDVIGREASYYFEGEQDTYRVVKPLFEGKENNIYIESWQRRKDGERRLLAWMCRVLKDKDGKVTGVLSSALDITERKLAEDEIRKLNDELEQRVILRTEQFEAANKELEAFSYSVSHDLRSPLRAVHSYTNILLEEYENKLDEEGKRLCKIISSSAIKMGILIDDLLNFSKIGRSSMNPSLLNMKSIASLVFDEISNENEKKRTKLKIGKLFKASGDASLIKLVWNNLISNAIKYSSKEPLSEISICSMREGDFITYSVNDNGVGFDMQYVHKLFGVFQRLHSESEFEGNGVGLAIVQRIVLKHNGRVWAEGEVGRGATFYFSLPATGPGS